MLVIASFLAAFTYARAQSMTFGDASFTFTNAQCGNQATALYTSLKNLFAEYSPVASKTQLNDTVIPATTYLTQFCNAGDAGLALFSNALTSACGGSGVIGTATVGKNAYQLTTNNAILAAKTIAAFACIQDTSSPASAFW